MRELIEGLAERIASNAKKNAEVTAIKNMIGFDPIKMKDELSKHTTPLTKPFTTGDFITATIMEGHEEIGCDCENCKGREGKPATRYRFPLPGHPAKVIGVIPPHLQEIDDGSGILDIDDLVIAVVTPGGVKEFTVSSRHFIPWTPDMKLNPAYAEWVNKQEEPEVV